MSDATDIRIAHIGDLHLGRKWLSLPSAGGGNLRERDVERASSLMATAIAESDVDLVVIAGDLFDSTAPSTEARAAAFRMVKTLSEASPVVIVGGNHDAARGRGVSPLTLLDEFFDCHVALNQSVLDIAGVRLHLFPFASIAAHAEGRQPLAPLTPSLERPNVMVAHAAVDRPELNLPAERVMIPDEILADQRLCLIMLGHIHQNRRLIDPPHAFYSGPIERLNFGESKVSPHALIHTVRDGALASTDTIRLKGLGDGTLPRPMHKERLVVTDLEDDEITTQCLALLEGRDIEGALISIRLEGCDARMAESPAPGRIQRRLLSQGALYVEVPLRTRQVQEALDSDLARLPSKIDDALREYLIAQGHAEVVEVALAALAEVQR